MTGLPAPLQQLLPEGATGALSELLDQVKAKALELPQAECPVRHHFAPGLYVREVTMPAGIFALGRIHKRQQLNIMLSGAVEVLNDDGSTQLLKAPQMFIGPPGRKVGLVQETMVWLNIWATDETDVAKLEAELLEPDTDLEAAQALPMPRVDDQADYALLLAELGLEDWQVREDMAQAGPTIPLPAGSYKFALGESSIEGIGIWCTAPISAGERIGPARIGNGKTVLGRYLNHSPEPNARVEIDGDRIEVIAAEPLAGQRGGLPGVEITIDYRQAQRVALAFQAGIQS